MKPPSMQISRGYVYKGHIVGGNGVLHFAVVLNTEDDYVEVVFGQTRLSPDGQDVPVKYNASTKRMGIATDTVFWRKNVRIVLPSHLNIRTGICPRIELAQLDALADSAWAAEEVLDQRDEEQGPVHAVRRVATTSEQEKQVRKSEPPADS